VDVPVKPAGSLVKLVNQLKAKQWQKIFIAANTHVKQKNAPSQEQNSQGWVEASSDYEIEDGDEDLLDPDDDDENEDVDIGAQPGDDDDDDEMALRERGNSYQEGPLDGSDDGY
jgi:phosphopantothenoylcysteine synthetase/decarboxylase